MVKDHFQRPDGYVHQLIKYKARTLCRMSIYSKSDFEDIVQDLWLHLLEQESKFDASRACFETFANRAITNKARSMNRHRRAEKRNPNREELSLNETAEPGCPDSPMLSDTIADPSSPSTHDVDLTIDKERLLNRLPKEDREPAAWYIDNKNKHELRKAFGLSRKEADDLVRRLAMNVRLLGLDE